MEPVVLIEPFPVIQRKSLGSNAQFVTPRTPNNDENLEKQKRQDNRVAAHRKGLVSTSSKKSQSSGSKSTFNLTELKEHYSMCIKLSTTNKINTKNAFGLHLIDYMSDLVKNNQEGGMNFKLASSALDAGAKIYCHRVDYVHAEAQKVASGLVMALDKDGDSPKKKGQNEVNEEEEENDDDGVEKATKSKRKKVKKAAQTIVSNVEGINISKIEANLEIDPLFHKLSTGIGQNTANSMLMINLKCNGDELLLNSNTPFNRLLPLSKAHENTVSIEPFMGNMNLINNDSHICPKISNFQFCNRDDVTDLMEINEFGDPGSTVQETNIDKSFMLDPNPEPETESQDDRNDFEMDFENNDNDNEFVQTVSKKAMFRAVNLEAMPDLMRILSDKPDDYSYFNRKLFCTWAGPTYWRANPFRRKELVQNKVDGKKSSRKLNQLPEINFFDDDFVFKGDQVGSKELKLKLSTLERWKSDNTLPRDYCYGSEKLAQPFLKKLIGFDFISKKVEEDMEVVETEADTSRINFENGLDDGMDLPDECEDVRQASSGFPTEIYGTQSQHLLNPHPTESLPFSGENLINAPFSIQQIQLPFAKIAKKINAKALKKSIWDILTTKETQESEIPETPRTPLPKSMSTAYKFSELYQTIPHKVSKTNATNLSPSIAFVTLLHIANEKNLKLLGNEELADFNIEQE